VKDILVSLVIVASIVAGVVGVVTHSTAESPRTMFPAIMKMDYVIGARTTEAVFLEVAWLERGAGLRENILDNES
jgi:hypothetical protein